MMPWCSPAAIRAALSGIASNGVATRFTWSRSRAVVTQTKLRSAIAASTVG